MSRSKEVTKVSPQQKGRHAKAMPQFQGKSDRRIFLVWQAGSCDIQVQIQGCSVSSLCGKMGHLQAVCYGKTKGSAKKSGTSQSVQHVQE